MQEMFKEWVRVRTLQNWKFWIVSFFEYFHIKTSDSTFRTRYRLSVQLLFSLTFRFFSFFSVFHTHTAAARVVQFGPLGGHVRGPLAERT